jgi:uncharacterized protein (TIGR03435 family)
MMFACSGYAQSANVTSHGASDTDRPRFDVISIHESAPAASYSERVVDGSRSGLFILNSLRVSQLIADAFDLSFRFQVLGVPNEMQDRRFDVTAKSDEAANPKLRNLSDEQALQLERQKLLSLLMDRFHLRYRIEYRPLPSYELRIAPKGTKLKQLSQKDGEDVGFGTERTENGIEIEGKNVAIDALPTVLTYYLKCTVINRTGLTGIYDLTLRFNKTLADMGTESGEQWPPLETAVQEQLGLKLFPTKLSTPVVVVEHIEMPSPN